MESYSSLFPLFFLIPLVVVVFVPDHEFGAVVVGNQFQQIVDAISRDLLLPLLNPFIPRGGWNDLQFMYFGGEIRVGHILDVLINSLVTGWALFVIFKAIKRLDQARDKETSG